VSNCVPSGATTKERTIGRSETRFTPTFPAVVCRFKALAAWYRENQRTLVLPPTGARETMTYNADNRMARLKK
jgi:hypothetical protein